MKLKSPWIEAMRLRTLPVSVAGVMAGTGCALFHHGFSFLPMAVCLVFAVTAQIVSNFANEYFDFKNGLDKKGREGYRRGVTEGDISPSAMKKAVFLLLIFDCIIGCSLIAFGGWKLIFVGIAVAIFAIAYSAGPYPLSHHGLGDIAVLVFFGFVPVVFTAYVQQMASIGFFAVDYVSISTSLAVGLLAVNVLIVNNRRDINDDRAVGKRTTAVIFGAKTITKVYLVNGAIATVCFILATRTAPIWTYIPWYLMGPAIVKLYSMLRTRTGSKLNQVLKFSSLLLFFSSFYLLLLLAIWQA